MGGVCVCQEINPAAVCALRAVRRTARPAHLCCLQCAHGHIGGARVPFADVGGTYFDADGRPFRVDPDPTCDPHLWPPPVTPSGQNRWRRELQRRTFPWTFMASVRQKPNLRCKDFLFWTSTRKQISASKSWKWWDCFRLNGSVTLCSKSDSRCCVFLLKMIQLKKLNFCYTTKIHLDLFSHHIFLFD